MSPMIAEKLWSMLPFLCLVAALAAPRLFRGWMRDTVRPWVGRWKVRRALTGLGYERVDGFDFPYAGGIVRVDHVVRLPGALLAIEVRDRVPTVRDDAAAMDDVVLVGRPPANDRLVADPIHAAAVEAATRHAVPVTSLLVVLYAPALAWATFPEGVVHVDDVQAKVMALAALHPEEARVPEAWRFMTDDGSGRRAPTSSRRPPVGGARVA